MNNITGALVLHLNCTALSQSEWSNFFKCIIMHDRTKYKNQYKLYL